MSSVVIRTTQQRGHARSMISATCKSSSVVILYSPTIMLHSEIHWYSLYVYFFYIALRRLTWLWPALFFILPFIPMPCSYAQIPRINQYGGIIPRFSSHLFLVFPTGPSFSKTSFENSFWDCVDEHPYCMLYVFFWVIPRRLNFICRRYGTLCLFYLHRQVSV
jgi:hypothetical protein